MSGGQRRRADLAASLVVPPKLLVLDEPTTGLDPRSRQVVWSTVRDLVDEGVTVLLTTQYLEEADALADHIVLIDHGRAVAAGTSTDLKALIGDQRVDVVAVDGRGLEGLTAALGGVSTFRVSREQRTMSIPAPNEVGDLTAVADAVRATGIPVDEIALRRPTLDDAFLALTGQGIETDDERRDTRACRGERMSVVTALPTRTAGYLVDPEPLPARPQRFSRYLRETFLLVARGCG